MEEASEVWGPVSTTLEYMLADASLAQMADALGHADDAVQLRGRAAGYARFFDEGTGLLRPLLGDGSFVEPFDPDAIDGSSFQPRSAARSSTVSRSCSRPVSTAGHPS